jgi:hypothetical protein
MDRPLERNGYSFAWHRRHSYLAGLPQRCCQERWQIPEYATLSVRLLRKFRSLKPGEHRLLLRTALVVAFSRVGLCVFSFVRLKDYLARRATDHPIPQDVPVASLVWAIRTTAAYIPRATCLTQVLAAKYQLERSGRRSRIHIGVANENGRFLAHAWLECEGETVLGGEVADRYTRLIAVD